MKGRPRSDERARHAGAALLLAGAIGPACTTPPSTTTPAPKPSTTAASSVAPLTLPVGISAPIAVIPAPLAAAKAPRLVPAVDFYGRDRVIGGDGFAVDRRGASERATFLVDCDSAGLDEHDALWMAGPGGLHRSFPFDSTGPTKALPLGGDPRGQTVVSGRFVAVFDDATLALSRDSGRTFTKRVVERGFHIGRVFLRGDGAVVVQGALGDGAGERVHLSRPGGGSFHLSSLAPRRIVQNGAWIWNGDTECPAVLSSDGEHWNTDPGVLEPLLRRQSWARSLQAAHDLQSFAASARITADDPPPPPPPAAGAGEQHECDRRGRSDAPCAFDCVLDAGEPPRHAMSRPPFALIPGACAASDAGPDGECRPDVPLISPPQLVGGNVPLPAECRRGRLASDPASDDDAVLLCESGGHSAIHSLGHELGLGPGAWQSEGSLSWSPTAVSDRLVHALYENLVLESTGCRATPQSNCAIAVRRPGAHAWREIASPGASRYWLFEKGAAAIHIETEGRRSRIAISWIPDDGPEATLIKDLVVNDLMEILWVNGIVQVAVEAGLTRARARVMADGSLGDP